MPVHQFVHDHHLVERGLRNYWGYNSDRLPGAAQRLHLDPARGPGQVQEFKTMVKALHAAGIEVILDVVYNHTAEGNHLGPTLSLQRVSTTTRTTASSTTSRATTSTTPAPATASTCATPTCCS